MLLVSVGILTGFVFGYLFMLVRMFKKVGDYLQEHYEIDNYGDSAYACDLNLESCRGVTEKTIRSNL